MEENSKNSNTNIKTLLTNLIIIIRKYSIIFRYLLSGGIAASTDLVLLYVFTDIIGIYYLISTFFAGAIAIAVSFMLQKFWTFSNRLTSARIMTKQLGMHIALSVINIFVNTFFVYVFVEYAGLWYIFAQIVAGGLIAIMSFFIYKKVIFVNVFEIQ